MNRKKTHYQLLFSISKVFLFSIFCHGTSCTPIDTLPNGFVYIHEVIPNIQYEIRYFSNNNFIGKPIDGYKDSIAILSVPAAEALINVQKELNKRGLGLKIYDAYRPQTAVKHFVRWAKDEKDTLMKKQYYPQVDKSQLFNLGYISSKSGHTRGSTLDLTIVDLASGVELDMGGPYDFFGELSHHAYENITDKQKANRLLFKDVMSRNSFRSYQYEWWHYTLRQEPYPETYFDFEVK